MKSWKVGAALAAGYAGVLCGVAARQPAAAQATIAWQSDYETARARARAEKKPLLVAFR